MKSKTKKIVVAAVGAGALATGARADMINLPAVQVATLLGGSDATSNESLSDPGMFVGTDGQSNPKRGLIEFDIADNIPAGATINSVSLQLTVGQIAGSGGGSGGGTGGLFTISLYDESQAWGQSTNKPNQVNFGGSGHGAAPNPGDATWNYAKYTTSPWSIAGGNWSSSLTDLADATVGPTSGESYTWSTAAMATDVQNWLTTPGTNFGWIIKNADETDSQTFRAFWGPQGAANVGTASLAPVLSVNFTPLPEPGGLLVLGVSAIGALSLRPRREGKRV